MKVNELMVGDWVVYRGDTEYTSPVRIEGMDILIRALITEDREDVGFDGIEPIPLTAEILEKNGFVYTKPQMSTESEDMVWQYRNDEEQTLIEIEEQTDDNLLDYYIGYFACGANSCEIYFKHVHQLQHCLKLVGIEKDIVL